MKKDLYPLIKVDLIPDAEGYFLPRWFCKVWQGLISPLILQSPFTLLWFRQKVDRDNENPVIPFPQNFEDHGDARCASPASSPFCPTGRRTRTQNKISTISIYKMKTHGHHLKTV